MSRFANGNILLTPSRFIRQCKMNIRNYHFCKYCHVRWHINWIQDFHLTLYFNSVVKTHNGKSSYIMEKNGDPYITKLSSLSSTRECDDDPEGTLFSWFGPILFLPHQRNVMDHSWVLAMNHICKNKKPCLYVHKKNSKKLSRPSNPSLGKWRSLSFIFVFYPLSCTS